MSSTLPSYTEATRKADAWVLVSSWIKVTDLPSCCLVSKHFSSIFEPLFLSEPTRLISLGANGLTKFQRFVTGNIPSRKNVLITTLDFRHFSIPYRDLRDYRQVERFLAIGKSEWFINCYNRFSSLKFIMADGLPGFDDWTIQTIYDIERQRDILARTEGQLLEGLPVAGPSSLSGSYISGSSATEPASRHANGAKTVFSLTQNDIQLLVKSKNPPRPVLLSVVNCKRLSNTWNMSLPFLDNLYFLDISGTNARHFFSSEPTETHLYHLRIFKARNASLRDASFLNFIRRYGSQIWSLDVRNNMLTDRCIDGIIDVMVPSGLQRSDRGVVGTNERRPSYGIYLTAAPVYAGHNDGEEERFLLISEQWGKIPDKLRPDEIDSILSYFDTQSKLVASPNENNAFIGEDNLLSLASGLTHLRIANNNLTSSGVNNLLNRAKSLQLLDSGATLHVSSTRPEVGRFPTMQPLFMASAATLLSPDTAFHLRALRIHHSIVTLAPSFSNIPAMSAATLTYLTEFAYTKHGSQFHPDTNPQIQSLTLTNLPTISKAGKITARLCWFLEACAKQEDAIKKVTSRSFRAAKMHSGLRKLRLEFQGSAAPNNYSLGPSVSGDNDADSFMAESAGDFSFFESENVVGGSGNNNQWDDVNTIEEKLRDAGLDSQDENEGDFDVLRGLKTYRRRTKAAFERGEQNHGHWSGSLQIIFL